MRLTTSQNALHFGMKCSKSRRFLGLRLRPRWGAYNAPPNPLVVRGFLPSCFAPTALAICPSHIFICEKLTNFALPRVHPLGAFSASIFFTSNISHYLKSLKICPAVSGQVPPDISPG